MDRVCLITSFKKRKLVYLIFFFSNFVIYALFVIVYSLFLLVIVRLC